MKKTSYFLVSLQAWQTELKLLHSWTILSTLYELYAALACFMAQPRHVLRIFSRTKVDCQAAP
jgi:hypothetical protein